MNQKARKALALLVEAVQEAETRQELKELTDGAMTIFRLKSDFFTDRMSREFDIGEEVEFTHKGMTVRGTLTRKSQKTGKVKVTTGARVMKWTVSWSLLRHAVRPTESRETAAA